MTNTETSTLDNVNAILLAELGEEMQDHDTVMDLVIGYAEPGYGSDDVVIVMGDWNPKRWPRGDDAPLTDAENVGPRLAEALEEAGAEIQWYDEWHRCDECYRAVRTTGDSYGWKPFYTWVNDCEIICADCALNDIDTALEGYVNDSDKAVTWANAADLTEAGWEQWAPGDPQGYEAGFHPGQNDDPAAILREILEADDDAEVVFLIDGTGQFDMQFSAWVKDPEED